MQIMIQHFARSVFLSMLGVMVWYSVYKKKNKLHIMFDNLSHFNDKHYKFAGYLD